MIRRPKAGDTEQDLLAFQERFLASRGSPSASIVGGSKAGDKRPIARTVDRDVVRLRTSGATVSSPLEEVHRPSKKSKFKEKRDQARSAVHHENKVLMEEEEEEEEGKEEEEKEEGNEEEEEEEGNEEDQYEAMDRQDTHITKVLASIQEHDMSLVPPPAITRKTKYGFPLVRRLEQEATPMEPPPLTTSKPKKSLFARQFESHTLDYFGVELMQGGLGTPPSIPKDEVNPISVARVGGAQGEEDGTATDFASDASHTWNTFLRFTGGVVSGEGLVGSSGLTSEAARREVSKMDQENARWLSQFSEQEILDQQEKIKKTLGSSTLAFLQARRKKASGGGAKGMRTDIRTGEEESVRQTDAAMECDGARDDAMETKMEDVKVENRIEEKAKMNEGTVAPKGWLHMDGVEKEKLEWTCEVPAVDSSAFQKSPKEVRFSLEGLVIPRGVNIPIHLGLHHHGDEPEAAGYTLAELVHLTRSAVLQQRLLALQTLCRIIQRATLNEYGDMVEPPVVHTLLEAGVPLLLRYSLDEQNEAVIGASVDCLHAILVSPFEEQLLDDYCSCYRGSHLPALRPLGSVWGGRKQEKDQDEEEEEETDAMTVQRDLVEGLVKVKLLPRLRYILEVCRPNHHVVSAILEVLIRICRHSLQAASEVFNCPRLMNVVFEEFLPVTWEGSNEVGTTAYGKPHPLAMRLVRTLASAGRHLTSNLISRHKLMDIILRCVLLHPTDMGLPSHQAYTLGEEGLRTWGVALGYGLGTNAFDDTYATFIKQLQSMASSRLRHVGAPELRRAAAMVVVMECAVDIAGCTPDMMRVEGSNASIPPPSIVWSHASGLLTPALHCLSAWLADMVDGGMELEKILCVSRLLHLVATHFVKLSEKVSGCSVEMLQLAEDIISGPLAKLISSPLFASVLQGLRSSSVLANASHWVKRDPPSLPSHTYLLVAPNIAIYGQPCAQSSDQLWRVESVGVAIIDIFHGYLRLCFALVQLHKGLLDKATAVLDSRLFQDYLEAVVLSPTSTCARVCFVVNELQLLYLVVKVFMLRLEVHRDAMDQQLIQLYHNVAFKVLSLCPQGMEYLISDLITGVLWHPYMFCELSSGSGSVVEGYIGGLSLRDPPTSVSKDVTCPPSSSDILSEAFERLCVVPQMYLKKFQETCCEKQAVERSKHQLLCHPLLVNSVMTPPISSAVLPPQWILLPITMEYDQSLQLNADRSPGAQPDRVAMVTTTLQTLFLLERLRPIAVRELPLEVKLARLMCVFLIDGELFLEKDVHNALSVLLRQYCCTSEMQERLDFSSPIPGLVSFYDLYSSLVAQFAAVSYGDPLFSSYLLLPLQQRFNPLLRRCLWDEHPTVLRVLSLPLQQSPVPVESFLYPVETDPVQLELYMAAIASGSVRPQWCPVLYLIAVHHVHSFVFSQRSENTASNILQRKLLQGVLRVRAEETKRHLLLYAGPQAESSLGFHLNAQLSTLQEAMINTL